MMMNGIEGGRRETIVDFMKSHLFIILLRLEVPNK